jgi:hypothetical protein
VGLVSGNHDLQARWSVVAERLTLVRRVPQTEYNAPSYMARRATRSWARFAHAFHTYLSKLIAQTDAKQVDALLGPEHHASAYAGKALLHLVAMHPLQRESLELLSVLVEEKKCDIDRLAIDGRSAFLVALEV